MSKVLNSVADLHYTVHNVILRPVITEKSMAQNAENKYTFLVSLRANKIDIRNAVEKLFNVNVTKVTTVRMEGKMKRRGRVFSKRSDYKKAYVTVKEGQVIEVGGAPLFER